MLLQPDEFSDVALGKMKGHRISPLASLGTSLTALISEYMNICTLIEAISPSSPICHLFVAKQSR
jgi:hypothetical protein